MKTPIISLIALLLLMGAGCVTTTKAVPTTTVTVSEADAPSMGPYDGWNIVSLADTLTLRIPPNCRSDSKETYTAIVCPSEANPTPPPDMYIATDGSDITISRWEDLEWEDWDAVIASIRILTPLTEELELTIQE